MLDQMSNGRLELGVGRGVSPYELRYFSVDPAATREIFNETLQVLIDGMTKSRLTFEGGITATATCLWSCAPCSSPTHRRLCTRRIILTASDMLPGTVSISSDWAQPRQCARTLTAYWRTWELHRRDPGRLNGHVATPKVGVMRQVVVAETDEEALAITRPAHADWYRSITKLWHDHDDHSVDGLFAWETATQHQTVIFGSPTRVREQIGQLIEDSGCNYVICSFAWGTLPHQQTLRSLRLFAREVMPDFSRDGRLAK